jgi:hypothetical protein
MRFSIGTMVLVLLLTAGCTGKKRVTFEPKLDRIDIMIDDRLITTWQYRSELAKPIFHPVYTTGGEVVTRWYPFKEVEGERPDHPHHTGLFFTYEGRNEVNFCASRTAPPQIIQND